MRHLVIACGAIASVLAPAALLAQPCDTPRRTGWSTNVVPLSAPPPYEGFGTLLSPNRGWVAAGDVDADGHDDIIIAAPECRRSDCFDSAGAGAPNDRRPVVQVISGRTGQLIGEFVWPAVPMVNGQTGHGGFGWTLAAADFNADGHADVAIAASTERIDVEGDPALEPQVGAVYVFSGATMQLMYALRGDASFGRFGFAMASVGDWNNDDAPDLMIADAPDGAGDGRLFVFSGRDGAPISSALASSIGIGRVSGISNIGDASGDAQDDAAVGGLDGFSGYKVVTSSAFGVAATIQIADSNLRPPRAGDIDGDGRADVIGMNSVLFGDAVCVYSGASGVGVQQFDAGYFEANLFRSMVSVGDVNDDGVPDVAVGPAVLPDEDNPRWQRLRVFSLVDGVCLGSWETAIRAATEDDGGGPDVSLADAYSALVSGDFDGDGLIDVASVGVLENQSAPPYFLYQLNIFRRPGCPEDMTGDGFIGFADLSRLLDAFNDIDHPGMLPADIDGDGQVSFADLNLILAAFNSGC